MHKYLNAGMCVENNIIYVIVWMQVVKPNAVWFLNPQFCTSKHNFRNTIHPFQSICQKDRNNKADHSLKVVFCGKQQSDHSSC